MKNFTQQKVLPVCILIIAWLLSGNISNAQSCSSNNIGFNNNTDTDVLTICAGTAGTTINGGAPAGGASYQWQVSSVPAGPYSNVSPDPGDIGDWTISSTYYNVAGTYYFRRVVSNSSGCNGSSDLLTLNVKLVPVVSNSGNISSSCAPTGSIILYGSAGITPYTYSLDGTNYVSGNNFTGLAAGTYTGYVQDNIGCVGTKPNIVVGSAAPIVVSAYARESSGCLNNGSIELYKTGGIGPFTYSLDDVTYQASNIFTGLSGGTYTGWVKDSKGCKSSKSGLFVYQPVVLSLTESHVNTSTCANDGSLQLRVTGGLFPYTYSLDNITFQSSNSFSGLAVGNYTGWVKDVKGCNASVNIVIGQKAPVAVTSYVNAASNCTATNGSIQLFTSGGTSPYTYSLDGITYQSSNYFSNLLHGIYTGYVKDSKGCVGTKSNIVVSPQDGTVTLTSGAGSNNQMKCVNSAITNITYSIGGSGTGATVSGLPDGVTSAYDAGILTISGIATTPGVYNYTVNVTGGICTAGSVTGTISVNQPPVTSFTKTMASSCGGGADGTISVTVNGGTNPYNYSWTGPGAYSASTPDITSLATGDYTVNISDAAGCQKTIPDITIWQALAPSLTFSGNITASCTASGSIILYGSNGVGPYTYSIDGINYQAGNTFSNLPAGTYTGYVKDLKNCVGTRSNIVVSAAAPIVVTASVRNASNCATSNGTIQLFKTGGIGPFTYSIDGNNYQTSNLFSNLPAGTYTGFVKDSKVCIGSVNITVGPGCNRSLSTSEARSGIEQQDQKNINNTGELKVDVFPNPSSTGFTLNILRNGKEKVKITVTDFLGRRVYFTEGTGKQQYHFGNSFGKGIYNVNVEQGESRQYIKLIKE